MASLLETDPSTAGSSSSDEYEDSDSVEIITDSMKSSTLGKPQQRNVPDRGFRFAKPVSIMATMATRLSKVSAKAWEADLQYHNTLLATDGLNVDDRVNNVHLEEIRTTPLFSGDVLANVLGRQAELGVAATNVLPEYGLLAKVLETFDGSNSEGEDDLLELAPQNLVNAFGEVITDEGPGPLKQTEDRRLFVNMNAPWSTFICGSQGSGKSHTLSCMLEDALIPSRLGKLPHPLAGMVFHYDKFTGFSSTQICEAAYLASAGIPVKVLVSSSNLWRMKRAYQNLPGFPNVAKPVVVPLLLHEKHLNVERMMKLMAVDEKDGKMALYMESVCRILRSIAMKNQNASGLNFDDFIKRLELEMLNDGQKAMLNTRLELLKSFMCLPEKAGHVDQQTAKPKFADSKKGREKERRWNSEDDAKRRAQFAKSNIWSFEPGTLTIVDLSCPFVDEGAACAMFGICLALFLEDRQAAGRIVALDEAHKFMTGTSSSSQFTESLLSVIRQQRHLATRIIIATQEPTISPALLDLSSMTIVHRFTSPNWLAALKSHLAGVSSEGHASKRDVVKIFDQIVNLEAGEALLFSPSAMTGPEKDTGHRGLRMQKLGTGYVKVRVRKRLTADGGRSILAA